MTIQWFKKCIRTYANPVEKLVICPDGRVYFNVFTYHKYDLKKYKYVKVGIDVERKRLILAFNNTDGYKLITINKKTESGFIQLRNCLQSNGIQTPQEKKEFGVEAGILEEGHTLYFAIPIKLEGERNEL